MARQVSDRWVTDKEMRELIERNTPMPLIKSEVIVRVDGKPHGKCPKCDLPILFSTFRFCPMCGQAIDQDNWAL